VGAEFLVYFYF